MAGDFPLSMFFLKELQSFSFEPEFFLASNGGIKQSHQNNNQQKSIKPFTKTLDPSYHYQSINKITYKDQTNYFFQEVIFNLLNQMKNKKNKEKPR